MRRIVGLVLVGVGVALIALAVALPTYVYPRVGKAPDNPEQNIVAVSTGVTALVPSIIVKGGNGLLTNQTVVSTRKVIGQVPPDGKKVPKGDVFYRLAFDARVQAPDLTGNDNLMQAYVEGGSINGKTGDSVNCCGDFYITDATDTAGQPIKHTGLQFKFPFNTQRKNYPFWDVNIMKAPLARYDGTEKIDGLQTYRFVQPITDVVIAQNTVPGALFGLEQSSITADRVYATTRTLWVEPETGAIIKGSEKVNQRLVYQGKQIPVIQGTLTYNDATVKANVKQYKSAAAGLKFVTKIGPIGGWILGPILVLIGFTVIALSRREDDEWDEDDWDDDEDDEDGEDDDHEAPSSSSSSTR